MSIILISILLGLLFILEILYFKIADRFNIVDRPNHRSSHQTSTIRGGGIIVVITALMFSLFHEFHYLYFAIGLFLISTVSFLDDIFTLNNKIRIVVHIISVILMLSQLVMFEFPWYIVIISLIFVIGTINAYNFMDGINGITGAYSFVSIISFYYINRFVSPFTSEDFLIFVGLSLFVFNFFNFRYNAKCFAGDVGSVSIAFIILFLLLQLIIKTGNLNYLLFLIVYGLDAVTTIFFRMLRKENVFEAHRSHFYQYCANERRASHLLIASIYATIQLLINTIIVWWIPNSFIYLLSSIIFGTIIFTTVRLSTEGSKKLFGTKIA